METNLSTFEDELWEPDTHTVVTVYPQSWLELSNDGIYTFAAEHLMGD
jgi:hypothetical protein